MSLDEFLGKNKKNCTEVSNGTKSKLREMELCNSKAELITLANQYGIRGISKLKIQEIKKEITKEIENGVEKEISEFEKNGYKQLIYSCSCKYQIKSNIPKNKQIKERLCPKCGKKMSIKK